jgi:hypothetical protein
MCLRVSAGEVAGLVLLGTNDLSPERESALTKGVGFGTIDFARRKDGTQTDLNN